VVEPVLNHRCQVTPDLGYGKLRKGWCDDISTLRRCECSFCVPVSVLYESRARAKQCHVVLPRRLPEVCSQIDAGKVVLCLVEA
jgi:hypothetical protein